MKISPLIKGIKQLEGHSSIAELAYLCQIGKSEKQGHLSRRLVIDVQHVSDSFHLYLLLSISGSIVLLSGALFVLTFTAGKYGRPEDDVNRGKMP